MSKKSRPERAELTTPLLLLMAVATGFCAGGNYFNQPLLDSIAAALGTSEAGAAATVTIAQVSYALGLLLLVPLGDMLERRALSVTLMLLAALGQGISGFAPTLAWLSVGTAMAGLFSVAAQVLVPFAATLAAPGKSGRAVGTMMSGLLLGILFARSVAGVLAEIGGWQTVYRASAFAMAAIALSLWRMLPRSRAAAPASYAETLRSVLRLSRALPRLRTRALMGALAFASVSALFSTMAFLLADEPHRLGEAEIGLVGLAGVAGALAAQVAGGLSDRGKGQLATFVSLLALTAGWPLLALGGGSLLLFVLGMVVVDFGLQGVHVSNQSVVYSLEPEARARLNSFYMTAFFVGAAAGSSLGTIAYTAAGWAGVCWLGDGLSLAAAAAFLLDRRAKRAEAAGLRARPA